MEKTAKNIEAIEEEKKEYLEELPEESASASSPNVSLKEGVPSDEGKEEIEEIVEEEKEVDIIEISFGEEEINEWIEKLEELREKKEGHIHLEIDNENELLINYEEGEEE